MALACPTWQKPIQTLRRLHDAERELGSLVCLDYWLENVMCHLGHAALCYHREGPTPAAADPRTLTDPLPYGR